MTDPAGSPNPTWQHWLMVAILGLVWGGTFLGIELALEGFSPFWLASGRLFIAGLVLTSFWILRGGRLAQIRPLLIHWPLLLVLGLISSALPFVLMSWGQQHVTSGFAGVSMAAVGLLVLPLAHFLLPDERMTRRKFAGFLIGFIGVCVLIGAQGFESSGSDLENWGRLACLGTSTCYALTSIVIRRFPPVDPILLTTLMTCIGAIYVIPMAMVIEGPLVLPDWQPIVALLTLAAVSTAGAVLLRVILIRSAGSVFATLTSYQVPVWAVFFGWLFLGEPLPASLIFALLLILSGVAISQWRNLKALFAKHEQ